MFLKTQLSYPTGHAHFATHYTETPRSVCHVHASCDLNLSVRIGKTSNDKNSQKVDHCRQEGRQKSDMSQGVC